MNIRLHKYKVNRMKGMNQYNAAKAAGYSESIASKQSHRMESVVKGSIINALEQQGLTDKFIAKKLEKLAEAMKVQTCDIYIKKENGKMVLNKNSNDFIEVDDNQTQIKATDLLCKLKKHYNGNPIVDQSTHYHFTKIEDGKLIDEARKKGIDLPPGIAERVTEKIPQQQD